MKPKSYWQKRSEQISARQFKKADGYERELKREYLQAQKSIQGNIEAFYGRFADNNEVSLSDAKKALTSVELQEHRMTLEEFTAKAKDNADGRYTKELNNAYYKVRVSRLEALEAQVNHHVELLASGHQANTGKLLGEAYQDTYYRTMHSIQAGTGVGASFAKVDQAGVEKVLSTKLDGRNWSQRVWDDRSKLRQELHTVLSRGFIRGDSAERMSREVAKRMDVSYNRARTLVQTETAFFVEQASMDSYKESGVLDRYQMLVALDDRTCSLCGPLDGKVFKLTEMEVGINYPPIHARCRCTTVPYFDDEIAVGERIAKNVAGETYYVPGDMTYEDWKSQLVTSPTIPDNVIIEKEYRSFADASQVKKWEAIVTPEWLGSMTDQEKKAITTYTGSAYTRINDNLRQGLGDKSLDELASQISAGLQKFALQEDITVFRGMRQNIFGLGAEDLPGLRFREKGYWSTSMLQDSSFSGDVQMELRVPANSRGAPVNVLSLFKDSEYEFLLDAGNEYRILEASQVNGKLKLIVEVVNDVEV